MAVNRPVHAKRLDLIIDGGRASTHKRTGARTFRTVSGISGRSKNSNIPASQLSSLRFV